MKRRTKEEWFDIINNQKNSGLSIKNYCIKNNISTCNFYKYKKLLINNNSNTDSCDNQFLPVQVCDYNDKVIFTLDGHTIECNTKDLKLILGGLI
ncbi:MAG: hypothetical protein LUH02_04575 [Erysipelotrichaceae bacterium]|nr:hypothetical protein [Erysipelotrichaceae bacterium]